MLSKTNPRLVAWMDAKKKADKAEAALKLARSRLEEVFPRGTQVPDDFPVFWQKSDRLVVADVAALPVALTLRAPDTDKIHAHAKLKATTNSDGTTSPCYPAGCSLEPQYSLQLRKKK